MACGIAQILSSIPPTNSNPVPVDTATGIELNPTLAINVTHPSGSTMDITWRTNATGSWGDIGTNNTVSNGTYYQTNSSFSEYNTTYWWSVNTTDGTSWDNDTYSFTTRDAPLWEGQWNEDWDISNTHTISSTGYLYGNWSESDHFADGNFDDDWTEANTTFWYIADDSSWWPGNYTYEVNLTDTNHSFAVLDDSGTNRSQGFGWVHSNDTEPDLIYPYVVFAYNGSQDFDCITWSSTEAFILHWNGTNMTDIATGLPVVNPYTDATDLSNQWVQEGVYLNDEGNYYKYIYNELAGTLNFKWWGNGFMNEPVGWCVEYDATNITHDTCRGHGIGVWNFNEVDTYLQWDMINICQLNYTVNTYDYCDINGYNESRPHMDFPVLNMSNFTGDAEYLDALLNES